MKFTGERVVPGQTDPDLMNEHWARYSFAEALVRSKRVLDAGCGAGYGAARLAASARQVVALDSALEPLLDGAAKYKSRGLSFLQGDGARLPFRDESFEAVVAFEVIEHLEEWALLLREAGRVLIPGGQLIISTPNRIYYGDSRAEPNPYHVHEFDHGEFLEALGEVFPHVEMFLENHADTVVFSPREARGVRTRVEETKSEPEEAHFFLAVCSKRPLHGAPAFVYVPRTANVLREREQHIALLRSEVQQKESWLASTTRDLEKLTVIHAEAQKQAQEDIDGLQAENLHKTEWARELETEIDRLNGELKKCIALIDDAEQRVIERTEWARRFERELDGIYRSNVFKISRRLGLPPSPSRDPDGSRG